MMKADALHTAGTFLFQGLCAAGGLLAPTLTATDHPTMIAALGAGALGMLGARFVNRRSEAAVDKQRSSLPDATVLLRNHDLNILVEAALQKAIEHAGTVLILPHHQTLIEQLAKVVPGYLRDEAEAALIGDVVTSLELPNLALRFAPGPPPPSLLDLPTCELLLDGLSLRLEDSTGFQEIRSTLAAHIALHFDTCVIAVFKEDATGRGPAQGRGWAALTLLYWGLMLSDVRSLKNQIEANEGELKNSLRDAEVRLTAKLDQLVRWTGPRAASQNDGLVEWLKLIHHELTSKLDEIAELVSHGLISPEEFRVAYWMKRRQDPGLEELWQDVSRAELLTGRIVGRSAQIDDFEKFLKSSSAWVQFWKGWPGTGKSRLMIEFAERATSAGFRVFFVSPDVHDLKAALLRIRSEEPVVLLWDDYQGDNSDALRVFLNLQNPTVKRVITSWPTHNVLGDKARDAQYAERDLQAIVPSEELVAYTRQLFPKLSQPHAQRVVQIAESQPEAVLRAVLLLLQGITIDHLPPNLLESAYDNLIQRLLKGRDLQERAAMKKALVAMALVGSVDYGTEEQLQAFEAAGISEDALGELVKARTVALSEQVHSLNLDGFRSHIIRRSLDHQRTDVLSGTPKELAKLAQPLLVEWFHIMWGICVLAAKDTAHEGIIRQELLTVFDKSEWSAEQAARLAPRIVAATVAEPSPDECGELANRIAGLRLRYDARDMALSHSTALYNASVDQPDPERIEALAGQISDLLAHYDDAEIAKFQAQTLVHATAIAPSVPLCKKVVSQIGDLRSRHNTPEIAILNARALYNSTVPELVPRRREELANEIAPLLADHEVSDIALHFAKALFNATVGEADSRRVLALADRIASIEALHDLSEIGLQQAKALLNASVAEPDLQKTKQLAARIGKLTEHYRSADIALIQAQTLRNATVVSGSTAEIKNFADQIGGLLSRYNTVEIALTQSQALYNATVAEPDPGSREIFADHIDGLLELYSSPEIALQEAQALLNATVGEPHLRQTLARAKRIEDLLSKFNIVEIAIELAKALLNATVVETDIRQREVLADRIGDLLGSYNNAEIAFQQARALRNVTVSDAEPGYRRQMADRIGTLLDRYKNADIASELAHALHNASVGERDAQVREALKKQIQELEAEYNARLNLPQR